MRITTKFTLFASVLAAGAFASACSEEKLQETPDRNEIYAREFIKEFGTPDPDHDWTMATTAGLRVNAPDPVNLKVYAEIDGQLYIFADIPGYRGENAVPVTIPKGIEELIVTADGIEYRCSPSATLDLRSAQPTRGSRNTHITVRDPSTSNGDFNISIDNSETGYVTFNLDENPALKKILDDPYNSEYLRKGSDNGYWLGGPLMPNASNHYTPHISEAQSFDIYPLYINDGLGNTKIPHLSLSMCMAKNRLEKNYTGKVYTLIPQTTSLYTSSNGSDWEANCMPSSENGPYVKSSRVSVDIDIYQGLYISYAIASQYSGNLSHSFSWFNYNAWGNNFYDAPIKDMNTCYCTTLFYKEVPVKWTIDGKTINDQVALYAMYHAPKSPADNRPEKPDVFFMEHHGYGFVNWEQVFEKGKAARPYEWRLFAEDLGGSHDWDFNDLVVEFSDVITRYMPNPVPENFKPSEEWPDSGIYEDENGWGWEIVPYSQLFPKFTDPKLDEDMMVRKITVTPLASGGTLPIYLAWRGKISAKYLVDPDMLLSDYINNHKSSYLDGDFIIGCEMHKWLGGSSHHTPLNVGERKTHSGKDVTFYIPANDYDAHGGWQPASSLGFIVLVDPENTLGVDTSLNSNPNDESNTNITPVDIENWQNGYTVELPRIDATSKVPQMFVLSSGLHWAKEGVSYSDAYSGFKYFANYHNASPSWTIGYDENLVVKE